MNIWHNNTEIPIDKDKQIIFFAGGSSFPYLGWYNEKTNLLDDWKFDRDVTKWAYVEDLLKQEEIINKATENLEAIIEDRIIENGAMFEMASHNKEKVLEDTLKILKGEK